MSRSKIKGPFFKQSINTVVSENLNTKPIKIVSKNFTILPEYIKQKFEVYNGKTYTTLTITALMVGYKIGEFVRTRAICKHKPKRK